MGAYENPQRGIDKQFEVVRKEQQALWGNVQQNLAKIQQQEAKRARQMANKYNTYYSLYDRGMKGIINDSNEILTNSDVSPEESKDLSNQINQPFIDGKNRITSLIKSGATDGEIRAAIDEEISGARSYAKSLGLVNSLSETWGGSVAKGSESDGKDEGAALITGNNYGNTFDALNGVDVGNLKFVKNGPGTFDYSFWYDKNLDGKLDQDTEILNLQSLEGSVVDGKLDIKTMPSDDDLFSKDFLKGVRTALDDDQFQTTYQVKDANGNLTMGKRRNKNSQYNDFMGNSGSGAIVNDFIRDREQVYFQKFFGANALADALEAGMTVDEMRYRVKDYMYKNKIEGTLTGAETKVKQGSKARSSIRTYENPVGDDSVRKVVKTVNDSVSSIYQGFQAGTASPETEQELTFLFRGSNFKDSTKPVADVIQGNLQLGTQPGQYTLDQSDMNIFTMVDSNGAPIGTINMADDKNNLVATISKGHFRKGSKNQQAVDYLVTNGIDADLPEDKSTTISSPGQQQDIIVNEDVEAASDAPDFSGGQAFESGYQGRKNPWEENITVMNQTATGASGATSATPTPAGGSTTTTVNYTSLNTPSGRSVKITDDGYLEDLRDGSTYSSIAKVLNFEKKGGYENLGFTGGGGTAKGKANKDAFDDVLKQVKKQNNNLSPDQASALAAEQTVSQYIIGDGSGVKLKGGNTSIINDLGYTRDEFDKLDSDVKDYLIDYKMNSGRGSKEMLMVASGEWDGVVANKNVSAIKNGVLVYPEGHDKAGEQISKDDKSKWTTIEETEKYNNFDVNANNKPSLRQLEMARRKLYMIDGRQGFAADQGERMDLSKIKPVTRPSGQSNKVNAKDFEKVSIDVIRQYAINNDLLPNDIITFSDGSTYTIPNY